MFAHAYTQISCYSSMYYCAFYRGVWVSVNTHVLETYVCKMYNMHLSLKTGRIGLNIESYNTKKKEGKKGKKNNYS